VIDGRPWRQCLYKVDKTIAGFDGGYLKTGSGPNIPEGITKQVLLKLWSLIAYLDGESPRRSITQEELRPSRNES